MQEQTTKIPISKNILLDGALSCIPQKNKTVPLSSQNQRGLVICHPHPLYGGNMDNSVVLTIRDCAYSTGLRTLRFNFRGTGNSSGNHDEGVGEEHDILGAIAHLTQNGCSEIHLAGYSFGAWVSLRAFQNRKPPASLLLVAPPVDFLPFQELLIPDCPCSIIVGERDEFGAPTSVERWFESQGKNNRSVEYNVLPGTDHFYVGREKSLRDLVTPFYISKAEQV